MKRFIIASAILAVVVYFCGWTVYQVGNMRETMHTHIDAIVEACTNEDQEETVRLVKELSKYWEVEERRLMHFVRHAQIDGITLSVSRLEPLARHGDFAEMAAELSSVSWQVSHIWESERPSLKNLF